jgi:hypothetical protein
MRINAWIGLPADDGLTVRVLGVSRLLYPDTMCIALSILICHSWCCRFHTALAVGPGAHGGRR